MSKFLGQDSSVLILLLAVIQELKGFVGFNKKRTAEAPTRFDGPNRTINQDRPAESR